MGKKFFDTDEKKGIITGQIKKAQEKLELDVRAFAVMSNHYTIIF